MTSKHNWANLINCKFAALTLILLVSIPLIAQAPKTQAAIPDQALQDKAMSFLRDVIELDLSKYKITSNTEYTRPGYVFLNLDSVDTGLFDWGSSHGVATFSFYDGVLGTCTLAGGIDGLRFIHPELDQFNATLGIMERYQVWKNDSQVQDMVNLLKTVGSEKTTAQAFGNLTLRITVRPTNTEYGFFNTINGVDYTGLTIFQGASTFDLSDTRVYEKIGDTNINISREQAIAIAEETIKNYSYTAVLANQTRVLVSNFTVVGVYQVGLQSGIRQNATLYPYWSVKLNVTNPQIPMTHGGLGVSIWANGDKGVSVYNWADGDLGSLLSTLLFMPIYSSLLFPVFVLIFMVSVAVVVFVFIFRNGKGDKTKKVD